MSLLRTLRQVWDIHFLGLELLISFLAFILFVIWVFYFSGSVVVDSILKANRSAVYGTLASIFGSLLGFVITALSIIIGYSTSEKFAFLRKSKHYPTLWNVFVSTIEALSVTTIMMVAGLVFDHDISPNHLILSLCVFTFLLSLLRLISCVWVLKLVIRIVVIEREP
jgi:hypothetical protein